MSLKIKCETKIDSEPSVITFADNKLFVGADDGFIKTFDEKLLPLNSWPAHAVQVFSLAAGDGIVYSSSNDGGIRVWTSLGDKKVEMPTAGADVGILHLYGKNLYAGDEAGNIMVYENEKEKARYNFLEEIKDLAVSPPLLFTVRDLDITATEIKPNESKSRYATRHTFEGRAPLRAFGTKLLAMARGGNNMCLYEASKNTTFKKLAEIKVSDMIVTSLAVSSDFAWTGGWDGKIRRWKIANDQIEDAGQIELGSCINGLAVANSDSVYAALAGGKIVLIAS